MAGIIALVGGDEFQADCEGMDRALMAETESVHPSLLVIPTAAARENPMKAAHNGVRYFSSLGVDASELIVLDSDQANDETFVSPVDIVDAIYLTGGDPEYLLEVLTGSVLLRKIKKALNRGAVLIGSSAGAMVLGSWMRSKDWMEALGLEGGVVVLPHHEDSNPDTVLNNLEESVSSGVAILGIDSKTCCFRDSVNWKILGAGEVTVYQAGRWRRYCSGEVLRLDNTGTSCR